MFRTRVLGRATLLATAVGLALLTTACGGEDSGTPAAGAPAGTSAPAPSTGSSMPAGTAAATAGDSFGPACGQVPSTGAGSFEGMAADPVATAASHNPLLSTLVSAVSSAGLVDTLNGADGVTVFAPTNEAFAAVPEATLDKALKDPKGLLTTVLTYHVVSGRLAPDMLAGTHKTLQGGSVTVAGSGAQFTVNGSAQVVCGNVQTANATVYLIDGVLLPKS